MHACTRIMAADLAGRHTKEVSHLVLQAGAELIEGRLVGQHLDRVLLHGHTAMPSGQTLG